MKYVSYIALFLVLVGLASLSASEPPGIPASKPLAAPQTKAKKQVAKAKPARPARSKSSSHLRAGKALKAKVSPRGRTALVRPAQDGIPAPAARPGVFGGPIPIRPEELAADRAQAHSEAVIAELLKKGDVVAAKAECLSAMSASARARRDHVSDKRLRHILGAIDLRQGHYSDAYAVLKDIERQDGRLHICPDYGLDLALAAVYVGRIPEAESFAAAYQNQFHGSWIADRNLLPGFGTPTDALASVYALRGVQLHFTGRREGAERELEHAAKLRPENAYIALMRCNALLTLGRYVEAEACVKIASEKGTGDLAKDAAARLIGISGMARLQRAAAGR